MAKFMAPSEADSVSFDPHRDKQALADVIADAEIANGPPLHDVHFGAGMSQVEAREMLDPIVAEQIEDERLGDEITFDGQRQAAQDMLDAKVNSEIVRRGQVRSEFNRGEEQFAGRVGAAPYTRDDP